MVLVGGPGDLSCLTFAAGGTANREHSVAQVAAAGLPFPVREVTPRFWSGKPKVLT
jgi:hypothetical protein